MDVSLLIRLIDQVSAPAKKVGEALNGIGDRAGELAQEFRSGFGQAIRQGFSVENIETATKNAEVAIGRARGRLMGAFGQMMALAAPVIQSGRFDQSIRGLDKVLDVTIERLAELRRFALDTSALVPIAARDLVELMSEAAQAGVPETELEAFSLYVARAAVAFDMAGAEIGERFAKLRNVYRLNQEGVEDLGDATNHLSNNMAAKASEITDFANRAAGAAAIFKLTATEISAVGTAMIAAGIVPETAARGFTALATRILSGGKDIERAFKAIGMNRKQFMKMLDEDAPAALQHLFTTMAKSEKGMQALIDLVGRDFADDFAKFLGNPELLAQAFELVADKAAYAGSATDEAAKQAAGAVKRWELFQNKMTRIAVVIGDQLLPPLIEALDSVGALVDRLAELAQANPEIASTAVTAIAALMGLSVASRLLAYGVALVRLPLIHLVGAFLKFDEAGRNVATGWRVLSAIGRMLGGTFS
ncbi:MAG: phage tail tape measure protein, partial [Aquamicrobium sp.]|nr:phage tail tape measure protein [Aquamicrobium sp.]